MLAVQVMLPEQDVVLQSPGQWQEADEDGRPELTEAQTSADGQATEMLQGAGAL